jgi:hypothetical protein
MIKKYLVIIFALLFGSINISNCQLDNESAYIKVKSEYITHFNDLMRPMITDSLINIDKKALVDLEKRLLEIMKDSKFSTRGRINLLTLLPYVDFGLLDGLAFEVDSLKIVYTTKKIFYSDFRDSNISQLENLSPNNLAEIFSTTFITDASCYNFSSFRLNPHNGYSGYGMIGAGTNGFGPIPADYLYVILSKGNYIYLVSKRISKFKELPICKSLWDKIGNSDGAMDEYAACYQDQLKYDSQFKDFQRQIEKMANYLEK